MTAFIDTIKKLGEIMRLAGPEVPNSYEFILQRGLVFEKTPESYHNVGYPIKQCFGNALRHALRREMVYVEGYACLPNVPMPIHHAWCAKPGSLEVVDPTTDNLLGYIGIPFVDVFVDELVEDHRFENTLIDDWGNNWPLLRMPEGELQNVIHRGWESHYPDDRNPWRTIRSSEVRGEPRGGSA